MRGGDGSDIVVLVDHYRHMVGETRRENVRRKTNQHNQALQFHKHVHIKLSGKAMSRA